MLLSSLLRHDLLKVSVIKAKCSPPFVPQTTVMRTVSPNIAVTTVIYPVRKTAIKLFFLRVETHIFQYFSRCEGKMMEILIFLEILKYS